VVKVAEPRHVLLAVISSFVLAELGDKTMLATVALASDHHWAGVWIGATAGMVLADGVAVAVGAVLHKRLPEHFLHGMASVLFLLFGLWLLFDGGIGLRWVAVGVTAASIRRRSRRLNRRRTLADPRLATVRRTTDQLPAVTSRSRATCRGAERRASAPPACLDN
jgi:O-antigen ligase